jgi:hypothetical protein
MEVLNSSFGKTRDEIKYQDESSIEDKNRGPNWFFSPTFDPHTRGVSPPI